MSFFKLIAPSEILLIKALALGVYFGWQGRKMLRPRVKMITNVKFDLKGDI